MTRRRIRRIGEWTAEGLVETAASFRSLAYAWQWPASVVAEHDTPNERRELRRAREDAQRAVDRCTRLAETFARSGQLEASQQWLRNATTFWEVFESYSDALEHRADETTSETVARAVHELAADTAAVAANAGLAVGTTSLGLGLGLAAVAAVFLFGGRGR